MKTIFDFGMYDASDTLYYLEEGYNVVAVEANPAFVQNARIMLKRYVDSGRFELIHAAISLDNNNVELTACGDDPGSSSVYEINVANRIPMGKYTVAGVTTEEIIGRFGVPHYLKIDLEGADRLAVLALSASRKPDYLSFEIGDDLEELLAHITSIGFKQFKIINQSSFREISNQQNLRDRLARRIIRLLGFAEPQYVKRKGRYFKLGHSSGPPPWCSDGKWCSLQELLHKWRGAEASQGKNVWYDLHAM